MNILDPVENFAESILTADLAVGGTSITVTTGEGSKFPATADGDFNIVISDRLIKRCTSRSGDTLTLDSAAQEGTTDSGASSGDGVMLAFTKDSLNRIDENLLGSNAWYIDQSGGTSDTYGTLVGAVNGSNTTFTVSESTYITGALEVYLNGQLQTQGTAEDWDETTPGSGIFDFNIAPETGAEITVKYQKSATASGNADTVDDIHASDVVASGKLVADYIGWHKVTSVIPTRASSDDPTYPLTFAGVDITNKVSLGMRFKWTQNGTVRYGLVTAISFSTDTTLTIYGGTDYDVLDTTTYAISDVFFSHDKAPYGFPLDPDKWTVETIDATSYTTNTPTSGTWVNAFSITTPIGAWNRFFSAYIYFVEDSTAFGDVFITLSTANNTESDNELTGAFGTRAQNAGGGVISRGVITKAKPIVVTTKRTEYVNYQTSQSGVDSIHILGTQISTIVRDICAYL